VSNYLDEYLVRLGFSTDTTAFAQFSSAIRDASSLVDNQYTKMAKSVLGFQGAVTGAFFAAGGAALDIVDKVAQADQEYRLLALHMYTSLPVARELKIALDALGQPLENVLWDPELSARFHQLIKDQQTLTQELGPDFENQMLRIRDVRFEFTRFGVELQYLTMNVVKDLAQAFGMTADDMLGKMRGFNDWFITHMPEIADWITTRLKPALIDVWIVAKDTGQAVAAGVVAFTNLIGILSGDTSIQGTALSFDNTSKAILHCIDFLKDFIEEVTKGELAISHLLSATIKFVHGDFKGAASELGEANKVAGADGHAAFERAPGTGGVFSKNEYDPKYTQDVIARMAHVYGVDPNFALAVAQQESNFRQYDEQGNVLMSKVPGSHATGIFQLQPSTAKEMGVDETNPAGNIVGGVLYLQKLLKDYGGNKEQALEHYYGSKDSAANVAYAHQVLQKEATITLNGGITVQVYAKTDASPQDISQEVSRALRESLNSPRSRGTAELNRIQRNIGEPNDLSWSYGQ
jgi:Transglycosylase SLT domain